MSSKNTPNNAKTTNKPTAAAPNSSTPRKSAINLKRSVLIKQQAIANELDNGNTLNTAFTKKTTTPLPKINTTQNACHTPTSLYKNAGSSVARNNQFKPSTPKLQNTNQNACQTPTSLYRNAGSTVAKNSIHQKTIPPVTPKSVVQRPMTAADPPTPECFSKVSIETPIKRIGRSNTAEDLRTKDNNSEISNLTVAVRVRPMNSRECNIKSMHNIITVAENELTVLAGSSADSSAGVSHQFQYDQVFWSCNSKHENYADQNKVFQKTAMPLVDKAFEGYNACLFAYGQTGSGKSYSMMGIDNGIYTNISNK